MREDTGWVGGFVFAGGGMDPRMREDNGGGMGGVCTPILTFPPEGGREGRDGLAGSCSRGGRDGMGSCIREDTGGGRLTLCWRRGYTLFVRFPLRVGPA